MRIRRGIVKTVKWGGLSAAVLVALAWGLSCFYGLSVLNNHFGLVSVTSGFAFYQQFVPNNNPMDSFEFVFHEASEPREWWFKSYTLWGMRYTWIPLWFPLLLAAGASAAAWGIDLRATRRARIGHCPNCNYNRAGIAVDAVCPECGAAPVAR